MQEYLLHPLDDLVQYPINSTISYQNAFVFASFCCATKERLSLKMSSNEDPYTDLDKIKMTRKQIWECYTCKRNGFKNIRVYLAGRDAVNNKTIYRNEEDMSLHMHKHNQPPSLRQ
jgi:hypothetical protein